MRLTFNSYQYLDLDSNHLDVYTNPESSNETVQKSFSYIKLDPTYKDTLISRICLRVSNFFRGLIGLVALAPITVAMRDRVQYDQKTKMTVWVKADELARANLNGPSQTTEDEDSGILDTHQASFSEEDLAVFETVSEISSQTISPPVSKSPEVIKKTVRFGENETTSVNVIDILLRDRYRAKTIIEAAKAAQTKREAGHFGADYYLKAKSAANLHKLFA